MATIFGVTLATAKPASRQQTTIVQPDGTTFQVRLNGDEFFHYISTSDDIPVVKGADGWYTYADITVDGQLLPTGRKAHDPQLRDQSEKVAVEALKPLDTSLQAAATCRRSARRGPGLKSDNFPTLGNHPALVILVEFQDVKFDTYNKDRYKYTTYNDAVSNPVWQYWHDMLNLEGFSGFGGTGSCRDWFIQNSADCNGNPQFTPDFDVFGPVCIPGNVSDYGTNNNNNDDINPQQMVIDACLLLDNEIDFSRYDCNGDGEVDNIFIFYAGYGEADAGAKFAETIWPHSWDLTKNNQQIELDGVTINHYACSNETDYFMGRPDGIGTFVHEFSHVLGLPDLYATQSGSSAYTPGEYSVLDYGPYNNNGRTPPNYSAFERYALDWLHPEEYGESGLYTLPTLADSNKAFIVRTAEENEYFLIENRQQEGWDLYLPGHGMIIWHVDYDPAIFKANQVNNTANHQYVDLIEANKRYQSKYAAGHTFPGENNVTTYSFADWNRKSCGIEFADIAENGGVITKLVTNTNSGIDSLIISRENIDFETTPVFNLQGMRVANPRPGDIVICDGRKLQISL